MVATTEHQEFDELVAGKAAGLGERIHTEPNFDEDKTVVHQGQQVLLFDVRIRQHEQEGNTYSSYQVMDVPN